jgi:RND family efflux transporter MFP subunit
MRKLNEIIHFLRRQPRWLQGTAALVLGGLIWLIWPSEKNANHGAMFTAKRGNLEIKIVEGGSIAALEEQEIRSEVKGGNGNKILKIVEEGYVVSEQDVKNGKVLVELDSADLKQRIITQDIQFQSTLAGLIDAQQLYDIQIIQNQTDVKAAEQKVRFASMDFEKFMGDTLASAIVNKLGLRMDTNEIQLPDIDQFLASNTSVTNANQESIGKTNNSNGSTNLPQSKPDKGSSITNLSAGPQGVPTNLVSILTGKTNVAPGTSIIPPSDVVPFNTSMQSMRPIVETNRPNIDMAQYAKEELLGDGAAKQQLRQLMDDLQMQRAQQSLSRTELEGTQRLFSKGFASKNDLDSKSLAHDSNVIKVKKAETALDLYLKYEFIKQAEELLSKYEEALRAHQRARKEAISKLAQTRARLKSAEARFKLEAEQRRDLYQQMDKCVIRAEKAGLVVYATDNRMFGSEQIREGATVRERQRMITIPDMSKMSVAVKIHEAFIKKVTKGQKARIKIDAYADEELQGDVIKVGVLPDYENRWFNPDLKVYETKVLIAQQRDWLKPGMSAKVEIMVKQLTNVIYVPLQAVSMVKGKSYCYTLRLGSPDKREVTVGDFNDEFIEIKTGLKEGEKVLLRMPDGARSEAEGAEEKDMQSKPADKDSKPSSQPAPADKVVKPATGNTPAKKVSWLNGKDNLGMAFSENQHTGKVLILRSPSPQPSPLGRGSALARFGCQNEVHWNFPAQRLPTALWIAVNHQNLFPSPQGRRIKGEGERSPEASQNSISQQAQSQTC